MPERLAATAMLCRTSDRWAAGAAGAAAVGDLLGARLLRRGEASVLPPAVAGG